jgi:hypothetical protein
LTAILIAKIERSHAISLETLRRKVFEKNRMGKIIVATPQNPVSYISPCTLFPLVFVSILGINVPIYISLRQNSFVIKKRV